MRIRMTVIIVASLILASCSESPTAPTRTAQRERIIQTTVCPQAVSVILDGATGHTVTTPTTHGPNVPGGNPDFNERGPEASVTPSPSSCAAK